MLFCFSPVPFLNIFSRTGIMLFAAGTLFFLNLKTLWHRIAYKGRKEERGLTNDEVKDTRCERLPQPRYPDHPSSLPRRRQSPHGPPWPGPCARTQTAFHQSRAGHLAGALDPALVGSTASTLIKSLIFWGEGRGKKGGGEEEGMKNMFLERLNRVKMPTTRGRK